MKRRTAKILDKSVLFLATLGLAGNTYQVPSAVFWAAVAGNNPYVPLVLLGTVGVFGALTPVETLSERRRVNRDVSIRNQILTGFGHIHAIGTRVTPPLLTSDLGLHIWRRRRTIRHPVRGVLVRVATYRLGTTPLVRPFSPPQGKGVVGLCWRKNQDIGVNVEELVLILTDESKYLSHAREHGSDAVMNLSWREFERLKHRGAVFASPIRNGRNSFIGCVSVDASHGFHTLDCQELKEQMTLLCLVIGQAGIEST